MRQCNVPSVLWDYSTIYEWEVISLVCKNESDRRGKEVVTGDTLDISEYLDYKFYN